jgi:hypothetical protein
MSTSDIAMEFDEAMHLLEHSSVPQLAGAVKNVNSIYAATNETLTSAQAHSSCFDEWRREHTRQGRALSNCTGQQLEETLLIYEIFNFMTFIGEQLTNEVTLRGLEAFKSWRPLTSPAENEPIQFIQRELAWDKEVYHFLVHDFLVRVKLDVHSALETFEDLTRNCTAAVISRLSAEAQSIVNRASINQCSGQV